MWWERVVKKQIRLLFIREGTEAQRDARDVENVYHVCLYDLLQMPEQHEKPPEGKTSQFVQHDEGTRDDRSAAT